ncbi:MAG: two-component system phosphate regulon sensor histidine kinase PhoR [Woeseiaceae bacterium]|jgi:two-component system phosphate regulon sensor histidine kinase PhoR|tara:strand:- start:20306 stop:21391 length:1086 start_codon:yes stop_codon:yes gene_type:complete
MKFFSGQKNNTPKKRLSAEVATKASSRDLSSVLSHMNVGFMVIDKTGCISEINTACMNFLNISNAALGCSYIEILGSHELNSLIRRVKNTNNLVEEINGPKSGGMTFLASLSLEENTQEILVLLTNSTRIHKLESMRRDFIANISHELRTPLSVIRANAESLLDGALKDHDTAKKFSSAILKNSEKLTYLLSDILNLATIESGEYSLDMRTVNPKKIIEKIVKDISENYTSAEIKIDVNDNLEVTIDEEAFRQVVTNLLDNAIKYSPNNERTNISIRSKNMGTKVKFEIEDRGIGIPPKSRERVFERFYRLKSEQFISTSGVGLGLAIVKNLVNLMGGSIGNESAHPNGTIFWFTLNLPSK